MSAKLRSHCVGRIAVSALVRDLAGVPAQLERGGIAGYCTCAVRIALLDAFGGLAGDMFLGALIDLGVEPERVRAALETLGLPGWRMEHSATTRRQLGATKLDFEVEDQADHRHLPEILAYIERSQLSTRAKQMATRTFELLARSEAKAHKIPVERVHFHEVGAMDAILDVCGVCVALDLLNIDALYAGPMPAGSGFVRCAHGEMPVPVPAVVNLLGEFELRIGEGEGEMITPTGAALLAAWGKPLPAGLQMKVQESGYGAGTRERSVMRISVGEHAAGKGLATGAGAERLRDEVWVLETNLDDLSGEGHAFLMEALMNAGALDMTLAPVLMKKGRPGHTLTLMVEHANKEVVLDALFEHSSTIGVRERLASRVILAREIRRVATEFGEVRVKLAAGRARPEYEDCAARAREHGVPLADVFAAAIEAAKGPVPREPA